MSDDVRSDEPAVSRPPLARRLLYLSVPYLALLVLLLLTEVGLRLTLPHVDSLELLVGAPLTRAGLMDRHSRIFEGDPLLLWKLMPNVDHVIWNLTPVSTNADGIRYAKSIGPKRAGALRILCLGDSVTFGFRVPRVLPRNPDAFNPTWKPYAALVEDALRAANPGREIEVIPLAAPGYSSHQGRAWLARDIDRLKPDVVTACFGWNDITSRGRTDREAMATDGTSVALRRLLSSSQLVIRLGLWARTLAPAASGSGQAGVGTMRVPRDQYVENMLAIAQIARSRGAVPVLIGPVYRDRQAHPPEGDLIHAHREALREAALRNGVLYFEIPELTEDHYPENAHLWEEHIHPNHKGHQRMAEALLRFLAERKLLGDLEVPAGPTDRSSAATPAPRAALR